MIDKAAFVDGFISAKRNLKRQRGYRYMSYTALYRKFRPGEFDDVKGQDHIRQNVSGTPIFFAEQEERERQRLRKYLQRRSIVRTQSMEALVENVRCARQSLPGHR